VPFCGILLLRNMKEKREFKIRASRLSLFLSYAKGLLKKELKSSKHPHELTNAKEWMKEAEILAREVGLHERDYLILEKKN
jgi:hypothetical protein